MIRSPDGIPVNGTFLFYVASEGTGSGTWSVSVQ
jgi:hypothetical protein